MSTFIKFTKVTKEDSSVESRAGETTPCFFVDLFFFCCKFLCFVCFFFSFFCFKGHKEYTR